ncbi:MAG TPA: AsmA family protein [Azospirillaceae bacterium]|nr:AsmA family protein [Azospirillaceae bacterium]
MRKVLIGVLVVVALVAAAIVAIPLLVPKEAVVARLEQEVKARTGRTLDIRGPVDFSVLPDLAVTVRDVRFAGLPGGADLLTLGRLDLQLKLMPLLSGEARVDRFVLVQPRIALEKDAKGRANWDIQTGTPSSEGGAMPLQQIDLGDVFIRDGQLTYADAAAGTKRTVDGLNATLHMDGLDDPLSLDAALRLDGRPAEIDLEVGRARVLLEGGEAPLSLAAKAQGLEFGLKGKLSKPVGGETALAGDLTADVKSLAGLMEWLGGTRPEGLPVETLKLAGRVSGSPAKLSIAAMNLNADEIAAAGDLTLSLAGARPALAGKLQVSQLDLDRFLPPAAEEPPTATPAGWSKEPIDLSGLRAADVDVDVAVAGVRAKGIEVGATNLSIDLKDGRLAARLAPTQIFGGTLGGDLVLNAGGPAVELRAQVKGVQAEPLLTRLAGFKRLSGTMEGTVDVKATGASQDAMMKALAGSGDLIFRNGAVKGINVAELLRTLTGGGATDQPPQTDFAEMGGAFRISQGVARNEDFRLLAPLLRVNGGGAVDVGQRQADFRIVPKLVASIEGQGTARTDQKGLSVPILIRGPWEKLSYTPDMSAVAQQVITDPSAVKEQVQGVKDAVKGLKEGAAGDPGAALKGLLQGLGGAKPPTGQ